MPAIALLGLVQYVDYSKKWIPERDPLQRYLHKRISFQHERELRALIDLEHVQAPLAGSEVEGGMKVPVNVAQLVDKIYVSPKSSAWFVDLVRRVCKRYGLKLAPVRSSLYDGPVL